jgi:cell division protein ZapA
MAALNIAHEHLASPPATTEKEVDYAVDTSDAKRRIADMGVRISSVLAPQQQLDL